MNALAFVASVVQSLAWPVTALIILWIVCKNGSGLARLVKSIRVNDFELTLKEDLDEARKIAGQVQAESGAILNETPPEPIENIVLRIAELDTSVAILKAWQRLEAKVIQLIQHNSLIRFTNPDRFVGQLEKAKRITGSEAALYRRLRQIRNAAVHYQNFQNRAPSMAEVVEFDELIELLVSRLEAIRNQPGSINPEDPV